MSIREFTTNLARAIGFLGRFPVPSRYFDGDDGKMSRLPGMFPFAGMVIALPASALFFILLSAGADSALSSAIVVVALILSTGALHEDGLADTADGFGGGRNVEHALTIMKDSRVGTYGVLALIVSFGLHVTALAALAKSLPPTGAALALIGTAALSRAAMVWQWATTPAAKTDGIAASLGSPEKEARNFAMISGIAVALATAWPFITVAKLIVSLAAVAVVIRFFSNLAVKKIGGHTGDTIGATQQLVAITWLCALALIA